MGSNLITKIDIYKNHDYHTIHKLNVYDTDEDDVIPILNIYEDWSEADEEVLEEWLKDYLHSNMD